jgi:hypothetical protein
MVGAWHPAQRFYFPAPDKNREEAHPMPRIVQPFILTAIATMVLGAAAMAQERTPATDGAAVAIIMPVDGAVVTSPVTVYFGLSGMGVAPAGVEWDNTGHHHLLVDLDELPPMDQPLPFDDNHRHFGGGQTQATLELETGEHTLQLLLADWQHLSFDPPILSEKITITVE